MLNVLLVTLGLARAHRARRPVARARRLPRRHADRRDRVPLPGRGGHQAVPRRAARPVLRHRRHVARPARSSARSSAGCSLLLVVPVVGEVRADRRCSRACSARRSRRRCAPGSTSRRRASSRSCMLALAAARPACRRAFAQPVLAAMVLSMLARAAHDPVRASRSCAGSPRTTGWRARAQLHADRREDDGAPGPRDHLRLRPQRPEPRAAARGRGHRARRARRRPAARARGGRRRRAASCTATRARREALVAAGLAKARALVDHVRQHAGGAEDPAPRARSAARSCR